MKKIILISFLSFFISVNKFHSQSLWGLRNSGGDGFGTLFSIPTGSNNYGSVYKLKGYSGYSPIGTGNLLCASNGKLYGLRQGIGCFSNILFEYDPVTGIYVLKYGFTGGSYGTNGTGLIQANNGKLYGFLGSINGGGFLFEYDIIANIFLIKYSFSATNNGHGPTGTLLQANNGKLYGLTIFGGTNSSGVIYEFDLTTSVYTKLYDFGSINGEQPWGSLIQAPNGKLYGLTKLGGTNNFGVLFEYDIATNTYLKKFDFTNSSGKNPQGDLVLDINNKLVGMTYSGGNNNLGTVFEYDYSTNTFLKKYDFIGSSGANPTGRFCKAASGKLYACVQSGGSNGIGVILEHDVMANTFIKKIDYAPPGDPAWTSIIQSPSGKFYGLTDQSLYEYDVTTNTITPKFYFGDSPNGCMPEGGLLQTTTNKLMGLTTYNTGLLTGNGVIFEYDLSTNVYTKKFNFSPINGINPSGSLINLNSKVYGLTKKGGTNNFGVIFEYNNALNIYTKKHDFDSINGSLPYGDLLAVTNSKLLGLTNAGGINNKGVLFEYNLGTNTYTKKFDFGTFNGENPMGTLVSAFNGKYYGLTPTGGLYNKGVLFEYDYGSNSFSKKYDFNGLMGETPLPTLVCATNGKLYGITSFGGVNSSGVIFEFNPNNSTYTKLFDIPLVSMGPGRTRFMQAGNGKLYGISGWGYFEYDYLTNGFTYFNLANCESGNGVKYGGLIEPCQAAPTLTGSVSGTTLSCFGNSYPVNISIPAMTGAINYNWNLPSAASTVSGFGTSNITANFSSLTAGIYTIDVSVQNACGISNTSNAYTISVITSPIPNITASSSNICPGGSFTINPSGASTYTFSSGSNVVSPTITTAYSVIGTSTAGCISATAAIVTVTVNPTPTISASNGTICSGQSFIINPSGASTYTFSSGSNSVTPTVLTSYSVTGTSMAGCVSATPAIVSVSVNPTPTITVNSGTTCAGQAFTLIPSGANTYTYSSGSAIVSPTTTSAYSVTATDLNGCVTLTPAISNITVNALSLIIATTNNSLICSGQSATLSSSGANTYTWNTSSTNTNIVISPTVNTTYTVTGTDVNGCQNFANITQSVSLCTGIVASSGVETHAITIYPNPSTGIFNISCNAISNNIHVELVNALGQLLFDQKINSENTSIDISKYAKGIYYLKVIGSDKQEVFKLIKE